MYDIDALRRTGNEREMAICGESRHSQIRWPVLVLRSNTSDVLGAEKINVLIMY